MFWKGPNIVLEELWKKLQFKPPIYAIKYINKWTNDTYHDKILFILFCIVHLQMVLQKGKYGALWKIKQINASDIYGLKLEFLN